MRKPIMFTTSTWLRPTVALFAFVLICTSPGRAHARRWLLFGGGEAVSAVAELDPALVEEIKSQGIVEPAIGYLYGYFSIFFLDLLTFEGEHVLMDETSERFVRLEPDEIARLAGKPVDQLGKPFLYRFPLGASLIVLFVLGLCVRLYLAYRDQVG